MNNESLTDVSIALGILADHGQRIADEPLPTVSAIDKIYQPALKHNSNPLPAKGGTDAESIEMTRLHASHAFRIATANK